MNFYNLWFKNKFFWSKLILIEGYMKITELKTHLYEFENNRVVGDANSPAGRKLQSSLLIEVETDEGITGYSSSGPPQNH